LRYARTTSGRWSLKAYQEIIEDRHPVVVVSARDIARILVETGNTDIEALVAKAE
jgi:hypothetical protein